MEMTGMESIESQVQLSPFVLNNHSNSLKSHGGKGPQRKGRKTAVLAESMGIGNRNPFEIARAPNERFSAYRKAIVQHRAPGWHPRWKSREYESCRCSGA